MATALADATTSFVVSDRVRVPRRLDTLAAFREWAYEEYPERGWVSFLDGDIWVDVSMEKLFSHNQVKAAVAHAIMSLLEQDSSGQFVPDRMLWSNVVADLSTEPDGLFFTWETWRSGRLRPVEQPDDDYLELEGTPDMVLEVVSDTSVHKDTVRLRELYWRAGVREYWLADARGPETKFEILTHTPDGFVAAEQDDGWIRSEVFQRSFRLVRGGNPVGQPAFTMEVRPR